jgi:DNA-binding transcriptional regulator YiaG
MKHWYILAAIGFFVGFMVISGSGSNNNKNNDTAARVVACAQSGTCAAEAPKGGPTAADVAMARKYGETPEQVQALRERTGLSQETFARLIGNLDQQIEEDYREMHGN